METKKRNLFYEILEESQKDDHDKNKKKTKKEKDLTLVCIWITTSLWHADEVLLLQLPSRISVLLFIIISQVYNQTLCKLLSSFLSSKNPYKN